MNQTVLITGGAGFIGSHLADEFLSAGWRVRALDSLVPRVHGEDADRPEHLDRDVEFVRADVRDRDALAEALERVDCVVHLAALVGVGQSMVQLEDYAAANQVGAAVLLELLAERPVRRVVVASSMSIYGEGAYEAADGQSALAAERTPEQLAAGRWDPVDAHGRPIRPVATPETKPAAPASHYALTKFTVERLALLMGRARDIPTVALRFFNTYGPRQAPGNPYTGVLAAFAARLLSGRPPLVNEDGRQLRDFVSVRDVARACRLACESGKAPGHVVNVGSGQPRSVLDVAVALARAIDRTDVEPEITGRCRIGDARHCFADLTLAREVLGYEPQVDFEEGVRELVEWLVGRTAGDRQADEQRDLARRGRFVAPQRRPAPAPVRAARATRRIGANGLHAGDENGGSRRESAIVPVAATPRVRTQSGRPVLITGGAGFIGSNVADRLLSEGRPVMLYDNLSRPGAERNLAWLLRRHGRRLRAVIGDVRERVRLARAVRRASAVFHFAALEAVATSLTDPLEDFEVNAHGTLNLLEALRACPVPPPLLYTSTSKVYGGLPDLGLAESEKRYEPLDPEVRRHGLADPPLSFGSPHGCAKGAADQYVLDYARTFSLPAVVFRMSGVYGPRQFGDEDQGWLAHFLIQARTGGKLHIYGDGKQVRDALYVEDLVDAMLLAHRRIAEVAGRSFDVGGGPGNTTSLLELLELLKEITGVAPDAMFEDWRPADQRYYVTDVRPIARAIGWAPTTELREGVKRLDRWVCEHAAPASPAPVPLPVS